MSKKIVLAAVLYTVLLAGCATSPNELKQQHDQVTALRAANTSDREVLRREQAVNVATAALAAANASLTAAQQNQQQAHAAFESLYQASQPATPAAATGQVQ